MFQTTNQLIYHHNHHDYSQLITMKPYITHRLSLITAIIKPWLADLDCNTDLMLIPVYVHQRRETDRRRRKRRLGDEEVVHLNHGR